MGEEPELLALPGKMEKEEENKIKRFAAPGLLTGSHPVCLRALSCFISARIGRRKWTAGAEVEHVVSKTHSVLPFLALPLLLSIQQFRTRVTRRREMWIKIEGCHSYYGSTSFTAFKTFHHGDCESLDDKLTHVQGRLVRDTETR